MSLIVCTRNRPGFAYDLIRSIFAGDRVPDEIVVVDQSDLLDRRLESIVGERCEVAYRPTSSRGVSAARNEGIRAARHDVLVFVDDDVLATSDWFGVLVSALVEAGERTVVTGQVREGDPEAPQGFAPSLKTDATAAVYQGRIAADVLYPNNMAFNRAAVQEIGVFDVRLGPGTGRYPGGEDNDFCFRLLEAGYRILYEPAAILYHRAWRSGGEFLRLRWQYGRGQGAFYGKHLRLDDLHMTRRLVRDVGSAGRRAVSELPQRPRLAIGHLLFLSGIVTAVVHWTLAERLARRVRSAA